MVFYCWLDKENWSFGFLNLLSRIFHNADALWIKQNPEIIRNNDYFCTLALLHFCFSPICFPVPPTENLYGHTSIISDYHNSSTAANPAAILSLTSLCISSSSPLVLSAQAAINSPSFSLHISYFCLILSPLDPFSHNNYTKCEHSDV